ncbi:Uma2 family endonuclease [Actinomadura rupiterrae]|uniref:Uma2 family endonuclease n=1 Tax=Actinomadura rupiterrae TaxID=559627 RepID=UPI0020A2FC32|nr:Uma2 family endonuclease [Actinomadura rupiterrae]MCP2336747.1 Uma2 family endonuclease [Actinomadura rupiterrae]
MAKVLERPVVVETNDADVDIDEIYAELCERHPRARIQIVGGRIQVGPMPTWLHEKIISRLLKALMAVVCANDWEFSSTIAVYLGPQRDRYRPDLTVAPPDAPLWGKDHLHGDGVVLAVEVVSASSTGDDHKVKPAGYAAGGVPIVVIIDSFEQSLTLLSHPLPEKEKYRDVHVIPLGEKVTLPAPWNLALDTAGLVPEQ